MIEDAGKGLENFNKVFRVNPYKEAVNIKNQKQLDRFLEKYTPALDYRALYVAYISDNTQGPYPYITYSIKAQYEDA